MRRDVKSELVKSAAFMRREFLGRDKYKETENTIYIYDTDVIKANCAPWITGPGRDQGGNGYGEPISFVDPEKKKIRIGLNRRKLKAERVSKILASHALGLDKDFPVYQFQPHFDKTTEIYRYVRNDAEKYAKTDGLAQKDRSRRDIIRLSALIASRQNKKSDTNDTSVTFEAESLTRILNNSFYGSASKGLNAVKDWDLFIELNTRHGGVFPVSHAAHHFSRKADDPEQKKEDQNRFRAVAEKIDGFGLESLNDSEKRYFQSLYEFWRVSSAWPDKPEREESVANYSKSLALLVLLNHRLSQIGWRAVFVTGSTNVVDVAYGAIPSEMKTLLPDSYQDFGNLYLRHIWAYTSDALIEPHKKAKFINWLDGLLGRWAGRSAFETSDLSNLRTQKSFKGVTVKDCRDAFESWDKRTTKMVAQNSFISIGDQSEDLKEKLVARIARSRREKLGWAEITELLYEENDRANDEAFLVFSNLGVDALISAQKTSRHPPDLDFESLNNTKEIFRKFTSTGGYSSKEEFERDYAAIKDDCYPPEKDPRQFSHLRYLALGAAFASASRWSVALSQAQRAIYIIERSKERHIWPIPKKEDANSFMSGREAYFFSSVALRMISKHETDFSGSAQFLDKAYDALKMDKDKKTARKFDELRFLNERCAHSLSVYYFSRMTNPDSFHDDKFDRIVASLEKVLDPIKYFEPQVKLNGRRAPTLAHVALNTIQAHAIKAYRLTKDQQSPRSIALEPETLNRALQTLENLSGTSTEKNGRLFKTKLMECYSLVGSLLVRGCEGRTTNDVANAFRGWERTAVTEYDRWRYDNLRKLANGLIMDK